MARLDVFDLETERRHGYRLQFGQGQHEIGAAQADAAANLLQRDGDHPVGARLPNLTQVDGRSAASDVIRPVVQLREGDLRASAESIRRPAGGA